MTLRQAVARRTELVAGLTDLATFLDGHPDLADVLAGLVIKLQFQVRSKAEADQVIEAHAPAARPLWRNGVYMAELSPAKLPVPPDWQRVALPGLPAKPLSDGGEPDRGGVTFEMHFVPPIIEQAA